VGEVGGRAEGCFRILEGVRFGKGWAYRILARVAVGVGVRPPGRLGRLVGRSLRSQHVQFAYDMATL
jgi:hypothetical protein